MKLYIPSQYTHRNTLLYQLYIMPYFYYPSVRIEEGRESFDNVIDKYV